MRVLQGFSKGSMRSIEVQCCGRAKVDPLGASVKLKPSQQAEPSRLDGACNDYCTGQAMVVI